MNASCKLSSHITTVSMRPNALSKPSRQHSLPPWQLPTAISRSSYGTDLLHRFRARSTCCAHHALILPNRPMRCCTGHMFGTDTLLHLSGAKQWYTKMETHGDCGHQGVLTLFISVRLWTITVATITMSQKQGLTVFWVRLNCSPNIANSRR